MSTERLALRAPDYIKIMARLIADHGWCGDGVERESEHAPAGLDLAHAALWAVGGEGCRPRNLKPGDDDRVAEILDHLEDPRGLNMSVVDYEHKYAGVSADLIAWDIAIAAWRYETALVVAA